MDDQIKHVKSNQIFPAMMEFLKQGMRVRMTVTGRSMYPFLRDGLDEVELTQIEYKNIKRGDIVLILRDSGEYVLHRVVKKKREKFYIAGDAQQWVEGPVRPNQLIAKVISIWRNNTNISINHLPWKVMGAIWLRLLPVRYIIIMSYTKYRKLIPRRPMKCKTSCK